MTPLRRTILVPLVFCGLFVLAGSARAELLRVEYDLFARFLLVEEPGNFNSAFIEMGSGQGSATFLYEVDANSQVQMGNSITLEQLEVSDVPINFAFMGDTYTGQLGLSLDSPIVTSLNFFGNFNLFFFEHTMSGSLQCSGTCATDGNFPPSGQVSFNMPVQGQLAEGSLQQGMEFRTGVGAFLTGEMSSEILTIGGYGIQFGGTGSEVSREMVPEPGTAALLLLALWPLLSSRHPHHNAPRCRTDHSPGRRCMADQRLAAETTRNRAAAISAGTSS